MAWHYGPTSYFDLGRVYPRDRLREPFPRNRYRRRFGVFLIPTPPPANLIPDFVFVEPTRNLLFSLIAAPYPPAFPSSIMPGVGQLGIDINGDGEQVVAAWDAKNLPEILAGGTILTSPAPTIQQVEMPVGSNLPPLTFNSVQVSGTQIQAIVSVTGGVASTKYPTLAKVYINNASTWRYIYGDIVLIGPN